VTVVMCYLCDSKLTQRYMNDAD